MVENIVFCAVRDMLQKTIADYHKNLDLCYDIVSGHDASSWNEQLLCEVYK